MKSSISFSFTLTICFFLALSVMVQASPLVRGNLGGPQRGANNMKRPHPQDLGYVPPPPKPKTPEPVSPILPGESDGGRTSPVSPL